MGLEMCNECLLYRELNQYGICKKCEEKINPINKSFTIVCLECGNTNISVLDVANVNIKVK